MQQGFKGVIPYYEPSDTIFFKPTREEDSESSQRKAGSE
jgi:hypothetical protein